MSREVYQFRVNDDDLKKYKDRCQSEFNRDHQDMSRELIKAFAEGRITIKPTEAQKNERSALYHES